MPGKNRMSGKGDGSYSAPRVPKAGAKAAGDSNPTSLRAMPPKGRSAAGNRGGGRALNKNSKRY